MAAPSDGAVVILFAAGFFTSITSTSRIYMTPSDPYVFQGQRLKLCCNVSEAVKNPRNLSGEVVFERGDTQAEVLAPLSAGTACIEPETKERTPLSGVMFYCSYETALGYQMVTIDGPEPILSRPECAWQSMAMTCQVKDTRSTLLHPENVTYHLYLSPARSGDIIECTALVCKDGYCTGSLNTAHLNQPYSLTLNMTYKPRQDKTMVWLNISSLTPINVVKVVPSSFSVTPFRNTCLDVSWRFDNYDDEEEEDQFKEDLLQQLYVKSSRKMEEAKVVDLDNTTRGAGICLRAFTEYNITLRVRPAYSQVWSETSRVLRTLPREPEGAPDVAPGFATNGTDGQIVLYWRAIPEERINGPDLSYAVLTDVQVHDLPNCSGIEADDIIRTTSNSVNLRVADRQSHAITVVCVIPENQEGRSQNMSVVYLDHTTQGPEDVHAHFLSGSSDNVTVTITWRDVAEVHAVFWCLPPGIATLACGDEVWWQKVEPSRSQFVIGPMGRQNLGHLMYGVASQKSRDHMTVVSGFRWRTCVQERDKDGRVTRVFSCEESPTAGADDQLTTWVAGSVLTFVFAVAVFSLLCCRALREKTRKFQQPLFSRANKPPCLALRHPEDICAPVTHHRYTMRFQDPIRRPPETIPQSALLTHLSGKSMDSLWPTDNHRAGCNRSVSSELQPLTKPPSPAERRGSGSGPPSYIQVSMSDDSQASSEEEEAPLNPEGLLCPRYHFLETKPEASALSSESADSGSNVGCSDKLWWKDNHCAGCSPSVSSQLQPLTELPLPAILRGSGSEPKSPTQVSAQHNSEDSSEEETVPQTPDGLQYLRYHGTETKMEASDSSKSAQPTPAATWDARGHLTAESWLHPLPMDVL